MPGCWLEVIEIDAFRAGCRQNPQGRGRAAVGKKVAVGLGFFFLATQIKSWEKGLGAAERDNPDRPFLSWRPARPLVTGS